MNSQDFRTRAYVATPPFHKRLGLHALAATFIALLSVCAFPLRSVADRPDFRTNPLLAGKASLTGPGFTVRRELGVANLAPELRIPVELVYSSANASFGAFGFGWLMSHTESRRYGGDAGLQDDVLVGTLHGGVAWG